MKEASRHLPDFMQDEFAPVHNEVPPRVVVHFNIRSGSTYSWRVAADSDLRVYGAQVWLTRTQSHYDHWLPPGAQMRLRRGERVWISTEGPDSAGVSITSLLPVRFSPLRCWLGRVLRLDFTHVATRL